MPDTVVGFLTLERLPIRSGLTISPPHEIIEDNDLMGRH
jgi:hypothetical protein